MNGYSWREGGDGFGDGVRGKELCAEIAMLAWTLGYGSSRHEDGTGAWLEYNARDVCLVLIPGIKLLLIMSYSVVIGKKGDGVRRGAKCNRTSTCRHADEMENTRTQKQMKEKKTYENLTLDAPSRVQTSLLNASCKAKTPIFVAE